MPPEFTGDYIQDGANPGLAARYNLALSRAAGATWLLLLDQDTRVTLAYAQEAARVVGARGGARGDPSPLCQGLSRRTGCFHRISPSYRPHGTGLDDEDPTARLRGWCVLSTLARCCGFLRCGRSVGFRRLTGSTTLTMPSSIGCRPAGGRVFVMRAALEHEMSHLQPGPHECCRGPAAGQSTCGGVALLPRTRNTGGAPAASAGPWRGRLFAL